MAIKWHNKLHEASVWLANAYLILEIQAFAATYLQPLGLTIMASQKIIMIGQSNGPGLIEKY